MRTAVLVERTTYGDDFDRDAYTSQVVEVLQAHAVGLIVMAGFGTIFGPAIHDAFPNRILNAHPALLPSFKGWHGVRDALAYGVKVTGCTVHWADAGVDTGPIIAQEAVAIEDGETEESLHERIKVVERRLLVSTLASLAAAQKASAGTK